MEVGATAKQLRRMERRALARLRNEPPRLTLGEEVVNALTHGLGAGLAIVAMVLLLTHSRGGMEVMASCF